MASSYSELRWGDENGGFGHPSMTSVGGELRAARERLGWTLPAIATHLRIRLPFLEAIEESRIEELPGRAYALGFVRTYAKALGLDPAQVVDRFRVEIGEGPRRSELEFPAPVPDRGVPALAVVLVGVVVAVGSYAAWYRLSGSSHPPADLVQRVPERLLALVPERPAPTPTPAAPSGPPQEGAAAPEQTNQQQPPQRLAEPTVEFGAQPPVGTQPGSPGMGGATGPSGTTRVAGTEPPLDPAIARGENPRVVLRARGDAWLQVREKAGRVIMDRVFKAGETWPVPARPNLVLSTGNAGGTDVLVDGTVLPSLGGSGVVRHDLSLDPDTLRGSLATSNSAPVQPAPAPANGGATRTFVSPHNQ